MKRLRIITCLLCITALFSACLKSDLDELPAFNEAEITNFKFEYRWFDDAKGQLNVVQLNTQTTIDDNAGTVNCKITAPPASANLPAAVRDDISLANIVGYCDISTAASIKPLENTPKLGEIADFTKTGMQYEVIAADGKTKKVWKLNITEFIK